MAAHREARDLIDIGAYVPGSNPLVDRAVQLHDGIDGFLKQPKDLVTTTDGAWAQLDGLLRGAGLRAGTAGVRS
jgi:flagellum-specific ATP synthase